MMTEQQVGQAARLTPELVTEMEAIIGRYPVSKRSASVPLLHFWQNHFGYVDDTGVEWIARKLELEPIHIFELVTFYPWFRQEAAGKVVIRVCRTLSCAMAGSYALRERFCEAVGIDPHAEHHGFGSAPPTSSDGKWSVEFVECLASCGTAPVCLIQDELHEKVTPEEVPSILKQHEGTATRA